MSHTRMRQSMELVAITGSPPHAGQRRATISDGATKIRTRCVLVDVNRHNTQLVALHGCTGDDALTNRPAACERTSHAHTHTHTRSTWWPRQDNSVGRGAVCDTKTHQTLTVSSTDPVTSLSSAPAHTALQMESVCALSALWFARYCTIPPIHHMDNESHVTGAAPRTKASMPATHGSTVRSSGGQSRKHTRTRHRHAAYHCAPSCRYSSMT